jgi:hypothetical protein
MNRRIRGPAMLGSVAATAVALSLATSLPASAGVFGAPSYSATTTGVQVTPGFGPAQAFNDVRATVTFPFITGARSQVNLLLQAANGEGAAAELSLVYDGGLSNTWTLEWGYSPTGVPARLSAAIPLTQVTNSPFYLEIHYSTKSHELAFLAGSENAPTVRAHISGVHGTFSAPAAEVASISQRADTLPAGALQATLTRIGVTQLLRPANPSSPTRRLSLNAELLHEIVATVSGEMATPANPQTLEGSGLGAGSRFTVVATR